MELTLALVLPWFVIGFQAWLIYLLLRQYGRVLLRQDALGERLTAVERELRELVDGMSELSQAVGTNSDDALNDQNLRTSSRGGKEANATEPASAVGLAVRGSRLKRQGLPAGTPAPNFNLSDLEGARHSLAEFRGSRLLLVFSDPACGPCNALAVPLERLYQQHRHNGIEVVMISRGSREANVAKVREHSVTFPVLLQRHWEISKEYGIFATPVAYLIDEQGVIAKEVAIGRDAILQLV